MNPDNPLDMDATDDILHEVLGMKPRLDEIDTTNKPFFGCLPLFQTDISSRLKLSQQFPDGNLVDISELPVNRFKDSFNMIDLFLLEVI